MTRWLIKKTAFTPMQSELVTRLDYGCFRKVSPRSDPDPHPDPVRVFRLTAADSLPMTFCSSVFTLFTDIGHFTLR